MAHEVLVIVLMIEKSDFFLSGSGGFTLPPLSGPTIQKTFFYVRLPLVDHKNHPFQASLDSKTNISIHVKKNLHEIAMVTNRVGVRPWRTHPLKIQFFVCAL